MHEPSLPNELHHAEYWAYSPEEKFALHEEILTTARSNRLCKEFGKGAVHARNRRIWYECEAAGITAKDVYEYFGGNIDNLRRSLQRGTVDDHLLSYALHVGGIARDIWVIAPHDSHSVDAYANAVATFQHECETENNRLATIARGSDVPSSSARIPVTKLCTAMGAIMFCLCESEEMLNKWLYLSVPVALDFGKVTESTALLTLVSTVIDKAKRLLDSTDTDALSCLNSCSPAVADPATVLRRIAMAWNPCQLYCHFIRDEISF